MAIDRSTRYPGRFDSPTAARPQGAFKNRTAPGAKDGSYLERDWANDWDGFFGSLMRSAGLTANGTPDTALSSQYFNALSALLSKKVSGDYADTAGFINNEPSRPYIRNTSQAQNVLLATLEAVNLKIAGEYADQAGFINNDPARPYLRNLGGSNVPLATLQSLNELLPKRSFLGSDFIRIPDVPGGLIIQFGSVSVADDTLLTVSLPTAFPAAFISAFATPQIDVAVTGTNTLSATAYRQNLSSIKVGANSSPLTATFTVCWLAIGY